MTFRRPPGARLQLRADVFDEIQAAHGIRTRYQLAVRLGLYPSTLERALANETSLPFVFIAAYCRTFGLSLGEAFEIVYDDE